MSERKVAVRGGMFNTDVIEEGSGEPLLYLHGWTGVQPGDPLVARLAERYRVIAPRMPGFGDSTGTENLLDLHDLLYYELDLLDALDLRGLPVVGHSLGAMVAAELAALQPERFTALALIAPMGLWNNAHPVADFFAMSPSALAAAMFHDMESSVAQTAGRPPEEDEAYIAFMLDRAKSLATAAKYLWPIPNRGLAKRLHRVSAPTLLLWGESDRIVPPAYAEDFRARLPRAETATIARAGHLPQTEQPDDVAGEILTFLGRS